MDITIYEMGHSQKGSKGRYLALPVPPQQVEQSAGLSFADTEVFGVGEVTRFGKRRQRRIPLSFLWPKHYNPTICSRPIHVTPLVAEGRLRAWAENDQPVKVAFSHAPLNGLYTLRDLVVERDKPGHPGDLWVSCELVEYVPVRVVKRTATKASAGKGKTSTRKPHDKVVPTVYVVKRNDSLSMVARKVWGESGKRYYDAIWYHNRTMLTQWQKSKNARNKYTIYEGMKLKIPARPLPTGATSGPKEH